MSTFSMVHRIGVPLLPSTLLQSSKTCEKMLCLWDIYGLTWPEGDRAIVFNLKQRFSRLLSEIVPFCGRESWQQTAKREWMGSAAAVAVSCTSSSSSASAQLHHQKEVTDDSPNA